MKRLYMAPAIEAQEYEVERLLTGSEMTSSGDVDDIGYGGSDDDGTIEPSSREIDDIWY